MQKRIENDPITKKFRSRRAQAAVGAYRPMNIYFDLTQLNAGLTRNNMKDRIPFYAKVFELTGKWWGGALLVNDAKAKIAPYVTATRKRYWFKDHDYQFNGKKMADYDLLVRVAFQLKKSGNTLATAGALFRHPDSKRPITGQVKVIKFGDASFKRAKDSVNSAVDTMIHEFGHIIAFGGLERNHKHYVKYNETMGLMTWTGPSVLAKARAHYNCPNLAGLPLQTRPNGSAGGHWDENTLGSETMTPTTGSGGDAMSPMSLALCEDTKWYKANYKFAENFTFGKGRGCDFFNGSCPEPAPCEIGTRGFITSDFKASGYCVENNRRCAQERKFSNGNCMNGSTFSPRYKKMFGASYGGNCVMVKAFFRWPQDGYIYSSKKNVSVQAKCSNTNSSYTLTFTKLFGKGNANVVCTKKMTKGFKFNQMDQTVDCADPQTFCKARFGATNALCDDTCMQNGRCMNSGFGGKRRLQGLTCADGSTPTAAGAPAATTPKATPLTALQKAKSTASGAWGCWCYDDAKVGSACPDLELDNDGEGV